MKGKSETQQRDYDINYRERVSKTQRTERKKDRNRNLYMHIYKNTITRAWGRGKWASAVGCGIVDIETPPGQRGGFESVSARGREELR